MCVWRRHRGRFPDRSRSSEFVSGCEAARDGHRCGEVREQGLDARPRGTQDTAPVPVGAVERQGGEQESLLPMSHVHAR
jgi:hypothetical protein